MTVMTLSGSAGRAAERRVLGAVVRDDALQRLEVVHDLVYGKVRVSSWVYFSVMCVDETTRSLSDVLVFFFKMCPR